ncbi:sulfite exporter TauE/SafE family protein [Oceanidesulfovibrio indonesiensis]|uniref:Probable membrane transporter protein n=1 Tax=Oceanidesulfovibrio indonesiensis TaxID=54767 RepID=A0A7M3MD31_9BACT|nr:sulfite exporter TauE/SafE family protein [Oceanidesulfovibrio indonesiensis]TVM16424.1 sulfite exporter TauE/SafE family protein [Oceanidesulfovibrio indonesiensis]
MRQITLGLLLGTLVFAALVEPALADRLADAIAEANPQGEPGYLGIPGAPQLNIIVGFVWAIWVGWIFSTVGAFGGIMAGVGHITIFGLGDYAKGLGKNDLNKIVTDSIRVSNQWLVGCSAGLSSFNYYRMGRLVAPLGISLAIGSVAGSWLIPILTAGKINLSAYLGYFGIFVLFLGCYLFYETTPAGQNKKKAAKEAAKAFQDSVKAQADTKAQGVKLQSFSLTRCVFTFFGVEFSFNPFVPLIGGFFIAALASFLGVGGGFLLVPFLTSVAGLPMYLVAGTSAFAVFIGMLNSILSYMAAKSTPIEWSLIGAELVGIVIGSIIGPRTSKYIPDIWLKRIFVILALYVGLRYTTKGFLGYSIVPPF